MARKQDHAEQQHDVTENRMDEDSVLMDTDQDVEQQAASEAMPAEEVDIAGLQEQLAAIGKERDQLREQLQSQKNDYLSARAEVDNLRKRTERELASARKYALKEFVNALLPVQDSLEMGISAADDSADVIKLKEGSELTLKMLTQALTKFGVCEVNPVGEKFNPDLHEAMAMQPSADAEPNTVLQVVQKGYQLNDRLIRPAMVVVARAVDSKTTP